MKEVLLAIIFILVLIIIICSIISHIKIDVSYFNISNSKIDKNIKIMFLSDLHNRNIIKRLKKIIEKTKPDIIICGGDMVNESLKHINNFINTIPLFNDYKTYYTFGNHEERIKYKKEEDYKKYISIINKTNIFLINNKSLNITNNIKIYGLNPRYEHYGHFGKLFLNKEVVNNYIGVLDKNKFNILVYHNPLEFDNLVTSNADLILSGHIHAGIIRLPLLGALLSPDYRFFPKYYEGKYKKNNTTMIVSRGLGFSARIPFRINNNPEVVIINLKKK